MRKSTELLAELIQRQRQQQQQQQNKHKSRRTLGTNEALSGQLTPDKWATNRSLSERTVIYYPSIKAAASDLAMTKGMEKQPLGGHQQAGRNIVSDCSTVSHHKNFRHQTLGQPLCTRATGITYKSGSIKQMEWLTIAELPNTLGNHYLHHPCTYMQDTSWVCGNASQ